MSLHVEGQDCPVCSAHLFDDDDVVFCPICGAPHHRECYKAVGHCAFEADHGTPRQYERPAPHTEPENDAPPKKEARADKTCPHCGKPCAKDTLFCPNCGQNLSGGPANGSQAGYNPYGQAGQQPYGQPGGQGPYQNTGAPPFGGYGPVMPDPYGGVNPEEEIDGVPAKDMAKFVTANTQRYIPKFKKLHAKANGSWNWAAFLFPSGWLFFRKCYKPGILALLLSFISSALFMPIQIFMNDVMSSLPTKVSTMDAYAAMMQHMGEAGTFAWVTLGVGLLLSLTVRIIFGVYADAIYKRRVISGIQKIKSSEDLLEDYEGNLLRKGGVNFIMLLVALMASNWFSSMLVIFLT